MVVLISQRINGLAGGAGENNPRVYGRMRWRAESFLAWHGVHRTESLYRWVVQRCVW
jgi:hypothetical protein